MTADDQIEITQLENRHKRPSFSCGHRDLDTYLHKQAKQDIKRNIARVFVATKPADSTTILGYYTLSSLAIELSSLPAEVARKLPRHPIPAALLGRLAVSKTVQSQGLGGLLLADAIKRTVSVNQEQIAIYAIVVDAIDEGAKSFYQRYGFEELQSNGRRLFLPLQKLAIKK